MVELANALARVDGSARSSPQYDDPAGGASLVLSRAHTGYREKLLMVSCDCYAVIKQNYAQVGG